MVENTGSAGGGGRRMHAILLVQMSKHESTRSYSDYPSVQDALEGLLDIYETRLREQHPTSKAVSYDLRNLFNFLDDMKDLKALTWDSSLQAYKAWDKAWVKARLQAFLLEQGQARGK